jgi:gluconate 2-dehydrogenase gamma chain
MSETKIGRREFLTSVSVVGAASASAHALTPLTAASQTPSQTPDAQHTTEAAGYAYLKPAEQAFVEALADHMVPAGMRPAHGSSAPERCPGVAPSARAPGA